MYQIHNFGVVRPHPHLPHPFPHPLPLSTPASQTSLFSSFPHERENLAYTSQPPHIDSLCLFPLLPTELRLRIWCYASPGPRILELRSWGDSIRNPHVPIKFSVSPNYVPPVTLFVCRESRNETLRSYTVVSLGACTSRLDPGRTYVPWSSHPRNPAVIARQHRTYPIPLAAPYRPQKLYVNFRSDIFYLGPEFRPEHLETFLAATGAEMELAGLHSLALDRKLLVSSLQGEDTLRRSLHALRARPIREVILVPDDERRFLQNQFYYYKHELEFVEPTWRYVVCDKGKGEWMKTVIDGLQVWFTRAWEGVSVPKVKIMSVRRDRKTIGDFKEGALEIQTGLGDMSVWETWVPPETSS